MNAAPSADPLLDDPPTGEETAAALDAAAAALAVTAAEHAAAVAVALGDDRPRVFPLDVRPDAIEHMHRLDMAIRLLVGWTVGKPEAADEVTIELAAMTVGFLDDALRRYPKKEATP
jgi:hypothetical protein